jgi:opacity protein-like surface antigen
MNAGLRLLLLGLMLPVVGVVTTGGMAADAPSVPSAVDLSPAYFDKTVRPILAEYCLKCHSREKHKGDLDLERFASMGDVTRASKVWQTVAEQLANGEMPPKDKPQPSAADKDRLVNWVLAVLDEIARAHAGDPGPVVVRRLSNAEYTHTVRDLTGVAGLDPAREFPVDGAAGEGFMNTGNSLVMSPALLTKYLDAGKGIAGHLVLLPDGFRFAPGATRRDWTDELVGRIRAFYGGFADAEGKIPLAKYFEALVRERDALAHGRRTAAEVAGEAGLNPRYVASLWEVLNGTGPSLFLDSLRARWRTNGSGTASASLAGEVERWQKALWRFQNVGHMKPWVQPVTPLASSQEVRLAIPVAPGQKEASVFLVATDAGDGESGDIVLWQQPRLVAPGRPNILLRDVRSLSTDLAQRRDRLFASTEKCLNAAAEAGAAQGAGDLAALAARHGVEVDALAAWLDYLGIGAGSTLRIDSYFTNRLARIGNYDFVRGWGSPETPNMAGNASAQHVRIPGNLKPHSIAVHPSPKLQAAVGWRSSKAAVLRVEAVVTHAHPECGNGVTWSLELRRGATRQRLASGTAQGSKEVHAGPVERLAVQPGDLVSVLIGPRNGDHSCDLTAIDFTLRDLADGGREWSLGADCSDDVTAGNPHADRFGNEGVWHFYTEPDKGGGTLGPVIPTGSLMARWQSADSAAERQRLAGEVQRLLVSGPPAAKDSPDAALYRQLASLGGPLFSAARAAAVKSSSQTVAAGGGADAWGLDPSLFGHHPDGSPLDPASLCVKAPSVVEVRLPADLVEGCELVATASLQPTTAGEGSIQVRATTSAPAPSRGPSPDQPILVRDGTPARARLEAAMEEFRRWFPAALSYSRIVPVDEVITLTLFHREDEPLQRLMLDDAQKKQIDRLWQELRYVSQDALTVVDAFAQLMEYATQDSDPRLFEPFRKPINERAAALRQQLIDTQPAHLQALLDFAGRAYRRPLTGAESDDLKGLYRRLRDQELPHDEAVRLTLARVLASPAFLYRVEKPPAGAEPGPVSDYELATRLSYFLWSSLPDRELLDLAASGRLHDPDVLAAQARRMLRDRRVRRLATEFACQWLHIHDFDELNEKSERHFPTFTSVRGDLYEESILFFTDFFQSDGRVTGLLDADHTYLNENLARHYGIGGVTGAEWRRVDGVHRYSRGGILGLGATLAKQSGASRTSPILRGNWVCEVLLGDKLPKPPKEVPRLPEDETATEGLTVRQLVEKHSTDPKCSGCHVRIDPFGYALEGFDAIGRRREKDLGDRPIDTRVKSLDGAQFDGIDGLRDYILNRRRNAFVRQFCRKLLGYSLGRGVQLSDEPLLAQIREQLKANDYRITTAVEAVVRSRQFREIRGRDAATDD